MARIKSIVVTAVVVPLLPVASIVCAPFTAAAWEQQITKQQHHEVILSDSPGGISPATVNISQGDTVVWRNQGAEAVTITLIPSLATVCSPPVNFQIDEDSFYKSATIPPGETASLCFFIEGDYDYEVRGMSKEAADKPAATMLRGKVLIKK